MTEYFYTRSRATMEIAKEQGFEKGDYDLSISESAAFNRWRFPRTPHNVALMGLRMNDLTRFIEYPYVGYVDYITNEGRSIAITGRIDKHRPFMLPKDLTIIQRTINGKPYPFPVWDKEGV